MRKVLSFVLVLALVLGSFSMVFGASYSDMAGEKSSDAVKVLSGLGVISGYPDGTYKPDRIVTRAEMAKLIVAGLGLEKFATATTSKYPDMTAAPWAQGYVAYGTSLGFISGYPDGTFKPNNTVSYEEAASMIVRALGYTSEFLPGEWPAEWMIKAQTLGLFKNVVNKTGGANRGDIAIMLYNALDEVIGYVDGDNKFVGEKTGDYDNMLVRLGAEKSAAAVILGSEDTAINLRPYVGAYAETYWMDDEIIAVVEKSEFLTGDFDQVDCGGTFEVGDVEYKISDAVADPTTPFAFGFENGTLEWEDDYLCDWGTGTYTLAVDVSGKTITKIYSILWWDVTYHGQFSEADADSIVDDQMIDDYEFVLDDDDEIDLNSFELFGAASLDKISEDDVIYVYVDDENDIRKIEVGTETVSGEITRVSGDKFTVGGKVYEGVTEIGGVAYDYNPDSAEAGDEVVLVLDYNGDIYLIEDVSRETNYAIFVDGKNQSGTGNFATAGKVMFYFADDTTATKDVVTSSYTIDLFGVVSPGALANVHDGLLVEYGLKSDGKVDYLVSEAIAVHDEVTITAKGYYAGYEIAGDAVIFTYDNSYELDDFDAYGTTTRAKILDSDITLYAYDVDSKGVIRAMVIGTDAISDDAVYGVATDWGTNNTNSGYDVTMLIDGVEKVYAEAREDAYDAALGNANLLYKVIINSTGVLTDLVWIEDLNDEDINVVYSGEVDYVSGSIVYATTGNFFTIRNVVSSDETTRASIRLDSDVIVYEMNADDVYEKARISDIDDAFAVFYDVDGDTVFDIVLVNDYLD